MKKEDLLYKLMQIGIALSSERDVRVLLERILTEARMFTNAEGGSLYLKEGAMLRFMLTQNEALAKPGHLKTIVINQSLPLTTDSMAGYVGISGKVLNIPDVYEISPNAPYKFNRRFDEENHYRTKSMLLSPMKDLSGNIIGVLAFLNARSEDKEVIPFSPEYEPLIQSLASQAAVAYINAQLNKKLQDAYLETVLRLGIAAECREPDIAGHLRRISQYSAILAEELGLSKEEVENIRYASPLHDVGKIGVPDSILLKPGQLSKEEYEEMKKHTLYASKILGKSSSQIMQLSEQIALCHHEHYDGSGYPRGLCGDEIPVAARIVSVADVFDALSSKRVYKDSWSIQNTLDYIKEKSGKQFDPEIVEVLIRSLGRFDAVINESDMNRGNASWEDKAKSDSHQTTRRISN